MELCSDILSTKASSLRSDWEKTHSVVLKGKTPLKNALLTKLIPQISLFIDAKKAYNALIPALYNIANPLHIEVTQALTIRFILHGVGMLERQIQGFSLTFRHVDNYILCKKELFQTVQSAFEEINGIFGINIDNQKLAYIAQIFDNTDISQVEYHSTGNHLCV